MEKRVAFQAVGLALALVVVGCKKTDLSTTRSITDDTFKGKKYFFGFGEGVNAGSAWQPHAAEVRFDLAHMRDFFASTNGGGYTTNVLIADNYQQAKGITDYLGSLQMTSDDMYVQYSASHGTGYLHATSDNGVLTGGLPAFDLDYDKMADQILALPAKEVVIFTMSCFSGGLVDAMNARQDQWKDRASQGRSLFILSSSLATQTSGTTNPTPTTTDALQVNNNSGSVFGQALTLALNGAADQNKDGSLTLDEIAAYVKAQVTAAQANQTPVSTGSYDANLVFALAPDGTQVGSGRTVAAVDLATVKAFDTAYNDQNATAAQLMQALSDANQIRARAVLHAGEELNGAMGAQVDAINNAMIAATKAMTDCAAAMSQATDALRQSPSVDGLNAAQLQINCPQSVVANNQVAAAQRAYYAGAGPIIDRYVDDPNGLAAANSRAATLNQQLWTKNNTLNNTYYAYLTALSKILGVPTPPPQQNYGNTTMGAVGVNQGTIQGVTPATTQGATPANNPSP